MRLGYLAGFRAAGFDDESGECTEPVAVTCKTCGETSILFSLRDDGGADRTADLDVLVLWAQGHRCKTAAAGGGS